MFQLTTRAVRAAVGVSTLALAFAATPAIEAQKAPSQITPNYDLASAWTTQRVSKLIFDTSVTPRWLETSDRFWYSFQTREGRRFYLVDPVKKTKAPLFGATVFAQKVHCDAVEPRERILPGQVVRGATPERHDERLGRQIFGQLPANTTSNEAEDRSKVSIEDAGERAGVDER